MRGNGNGVVKKRTNGGFQIRFWLPGKGEIRESVAKALGKRAGDVTEAEATTLLKTLVAQVRLGLHVTPEERKVTVTELLDQLLADLELRERKSVGTIRSCTKTLAARLGAVKAIAVTTDLVRRYMRERLGAGLARGTVAREVAILRMAFRLAHKAGLLTRVPHFPSLRVKNARQGFVEAEDFERIADALRQPYQDMARFLYLSAWRAGEASALTWADVHGDEVRVDAKNEDRRALPIDAEVEAILERRRRERVHRGDEIVPWVFHREGRRIRPKRLNIRWRHACVAAETGLGTTPHDLRRSAIRNMIRGGVAESIAMGISGHRSVSVFHRYAIVSGEDRREAMKAAAAYRAARMLRLPDTYQVSAVKELHRVR